jgi:hypothetical protein
LRGVIRHWRIHALHLITHSHALLSRDDLVVGWRRFLDILLVVFVRITSSRPLFHTLLSFQITEAVRYLSALSAAWAAFPQDECEEEGSEDCAGYDANRRPFSPLLSFRL